MQTAYRSSNTRRARPACKPSACDSCRAENGSCSPTEAAPARAWTPNTCSCYPVLPESTEKRRFKYRTISVFGPPRRLSFARPFGVSLITSLSQRRYINLGQSGYLGTCARSRSIALFVSNDTDARVANAKQRTFAAHRFGLLEIRIFNISFCHINLNARAPCIRNQGKRPIGKLSRYERTSPSIQRTRAR